MEFLYFLLKENEFAQSCLILCNLSDVQLFATPWTVACKAPLSMGFFRQEYWSGLPFPSQADLVLSELFSMTCPSWVALLSMAHSFIELPKPFHHDRAVIHEVDIVYTYISI